MTPKEQLLTFIAAADGTTDPIRIMKGLFIFNKTIERQSSELGINGLFDFSAMDYGPCAPSIYRAIDELVRAGLVEEIPVLGETWKKYQVTTTGKATANALSAAKPAVAGYLRELRQWCDKQTFTSLLKYVYHSWPDYAINSVLPHLRPNG